MKQTVILCGPRQRQTAHEYIDQAPIGHVVEIREPTRNNDQNAKFHSMCWDMAKAGFEWAGKKRTAPEIKVLLVSGHAKATSENYEFVVGLEGELVNIRESTALMSKRRSSSLIEYTQAFCASMGIELSEPVMEVA